MSVATSMLLVHKSFMKNLLNVKSSEESSDFFKFSLHTFLFSLVLNVFIILRFYIISVSKITIVSVSVIFSITEISLLSSVFNATVLCDDSECFYQTPSSELAAEHRQRITWSRRNATINSCLTLPELVWAAENRVQYRQIVHSTVYAPYNTEYGKLDAYAQVSSIRRIALRRVLGVPRAPAYFRNSDTEGFSLQYSDDKVLELWGRLATGRKHGSHQHQPEQSSVIGVVEWQLSYHLH